MLKKYNKPIIYTSKHISRDNFLAEDKDIPVIGNWASIFTEGPGEEEFEEAW